MSNNDGSPSNNNDEAQPGLAALAKESISRCRTAALATHSIKHPEFPFASMVPYAIDDQGRLLIFVSALAIHARNLKANPNSSLLVTEGESLAGARTTLIGTTEPVPDAEREAAMAVYLQRNPKAQQWASFGDFSLLRMEIVNIYFVGGFGVMGWVTAEDYYAS